MILRTYRPERTAKIQSKAILTLSGPFYYLRGDLEISMILLLITSGYT